MLVAIDACVLLGHQDASLTENEKARARFALEWLATGRVPPCILVSGSRTQQEGPMDDAQLRELCEGTAKAARAARDASRHSFCSQGCPSPSRCQPFPFPLAHHPRLRSPSTAPCPFQRQAARSSAARALKALSERSRSTGARLPPTAPRPSVRFPLLAPPSAQRSCLRRGRLKAHRGGRPRAPSPAVLCSPASEARWKQAAAAAGPASLRVAPADPGELPQRAPGAPERPQRTPRALIHAPAPATHPLTVSA